MRSRGPSRSTLRSAAPGGSGTFASVSRASCVHWFFSPPFQPRRAKPPRQRHCPRSPLSLHPIGGLRWPSTRRGWAGCRCLGAPRRPRASDPVVPPHQSPRAPLVPAAPLLGRAGTPAARPAPSPCEPAAALPAGGRAEARAGAGRGGAPGARSPALSSLRLASRRAPSSPAAHHGRAARSGVGGRLPSALGGQLVGT